MDGWQYTKRELRLYVQDVELNLAGVMSNGQYYMSLSFFFFFFSRG